MKGSWILILCSLSAPGQRALGSIFPPTDDSSTRAETPAQNNWPIHVEITPIVQSAAPLTPVVIEEIAATEVHSEQEPVRPISSEVKRLPDQLPQPVAQQYQPQQQEQRPEINQQVQVQQREQQQEQIQQHQVLLQQEQIQQHQVQLQQEQIQQHQVQLQQEQIQQHQVQLLQDQIQQQQEQQQEQDQKHPVEQQQKPTEIIITSTPDGVSSVMPLLTIGDIIMGNNSSLPVVTKNSSTGN